MRTDSPMCKYQTGFRLHCVAEGKSPKTTQWYGHKLRIFGEYLDEQCAVADPGVATADQVRAFLAHMREDVQVGELNPHRKTGEKNLSPQTVQGYYRAIRAFYSWLLREGYLETDPTATIRRPKAAQTIVATFDEDQIRRLLAAPDKRTPRGYRDYVILLLLLDTGIRLGELVRLRVADMHLEDGYVQVYGKGSKERLVPVGNAVRKALWRYLAQYRPEPAHPGVQNVFLAPGGQPLKGESVYRMISRRGQEAEIKGVRCSPHTLRHTFAVSFLRNGGDVFSLQRILGHTSLVVTRMYCNLVDADIRAAHRRCSPADRLG